MFFLFSHHGLSPAEGLQHLPLPFTITSFNFHANERLAPRTATYYHITFSPYCLQALGYVGIAFHTSQIVITVICCGSVPCNVGNYTGL